MAVTYIGAALEGSKHLSSLDLSKWMATYDSKMYPVNPLFILDTSVDISSLDISTDVSILDISRIYGLISYSLDTF